MARAFANIHKSVVLVVDVQPKFLNGMFEADRVLHRSEFLLRCAKLLDVQVIATEQNRERMGGSAASLTGWFSGPAEAKMTFSCSTCEVFQRHFAPAPPMQAILVGIETHICVSQTAHELLELGHEVIVCADAVSARTQDRHEIGLSRLQSAGAVIGHTESIVYEWMRSADHPKFKEVLETVKQFAL